MAKGRSYFPVRIDIPSLSGGVGRSSPSKRVPTESENVDNMIVSLEHSAEKRRGVELLEWTDASLIGRLPEVSDAQNDTDAAPKDLWMHWFLVSSTAKYLIVVDYKATADTDDLLWVYKVDADGELSLQYDYQPVSSDDEYADFGISREYLTYGSDTYTAKEALRAVAVGSSILILNTKVKAGFTSDESGDNLLKNMGGGVSSETDHIGPALKYLTAATVDEKNDAEIWTAYTQYIAGDHAYDAEDRMVDDTLLIDYDDEGDNVPDTALVTGYDYLRKGLWQVTDTAADVVGPIGVGLSPRRPSSAIGALNMNHGDNQGNMHKNFMTLGPMTGGTSTTKAAMKVQILDPSDQSVPDKDDLLADLGTGWFNDTGAVGSTGYDNRMGLPLWQDGENYVEVVDGVPYEKVRFYLDEAMDETANPDDSGWDVRGYNSAHTNVLWDPDPNSATYQPDPVGNMHFKIYVGGGTITTVRQLVEHFCNAFNWYQAQGVLSLVATPDALLTGWEFESTFFTEQWERVRKDPMPAAYLTSGEVDETLLIEAHAAYDTSLDIDDYDVWTEGWARYTDYIEASDYFYPNPETKFLGQAVASLTDLKFPPDSTDLSAFNGGNEVETVLRVLYDDIGDVENDGTTATGRGKLYYLSQQYLGLAEGYFRVKDIEEQPYLHKIRTPEIMSIIDKRRMPRQLVLNDDATTFDDIAATATLEVVNAYNLDFNGDGSEGFTITDASGLVHTFYVDRDTDATVDNIVGVDTAQNWSYEGDAAQQFVDTINDSSSTCAGQITAVLTTYVGGEAGVGIVTLTQNTRGAAGNKESTGPFVAPSAFKLSDFTGGIDVTSQWEIRPVDWDPRDSGGVISNPGPSLFHDGNGKAIQRAISAMAFYRGRLFLASEDMLVSSRINDFDNFWIDSPDSLTVADPIDLRVSSNAYTPITYLQPYRNFLFLATDGSIQYELVGSENQISPLTAEIAPTSFYNMTLDVSPVLLNNSLFFLDAKRLYIYFGEQAESTQNAIDISINCPGYLPSSFGDITTSPATNTLFIVDADKTNEVYCYTNRVSGDQLSQNSFFRFIFPDTWNIKSVVGIEEHLYLVWEEELPNSAPETPETWTGVNIGRLYLRNEDLFLPRMDSLMLRTAALHIPTGGEPAFNAISNETTFVVSAPTTDLNTIVLWDDDDENANVDNVRGELLDIVSATTADPTVYPNAVQIVVATDKTDELSAIDGFYLGEKYTANVELSPQFLRGENLEAQNGSLNLRLGMFRFRNSGDFEVTVTRKERARDARTFVIDMVDSATGVRLEYQPYKEFGIFKLPILGFTHDLTIALTSTSVHPLAISDIEFTGKFKYKLNAIGAM